MLHSPGRVVAAATTIALTLLPLYASSPRFFQVFTYADFLKGDVENLSIDSNGQLGLSPGTELVYETSAPFLWTVLAQPDGTVFVGTGNEGKVFKIDAQENGSLFFDSAELEVHALAPAPDGGLYVATSPEGKIYKVDRNGNGSEFFDPDDKYIWALAVDAKGNVYAGTGEKGAIYKIPPDGKGILFYRTNTTHVTAMSLDKAGNIVAGTGSPGRVLRIDADGKGFVLLDSPFQEIRILRFDVKGMLYAAALSGRPPGGGTSSPPEVPTPERTSSKSRAPVPSVSTEITATSIVDTGSGSSTPDGRRTSKGAIYRIAPDGVWDQLWESPDDSPYDLAFDQQGAVIVGTGGKGKIYRLEGDPPRPTLFARARAQQVTAFDRDPRGRLYYTTANPGKLFRLSQDRATRGSYESEAWDAQTVAAWGIIRWRGSAPEGNRIELFTRSGNTEIPDDTWSPWSAAYTKAEGSSITSPKARYLQWRAVLTGKGGDSPTLTSITAAYLQRNLRPRVRSITVHPPGIVFQKPFNTGDPDIAGFDGQTTPERKMASAAASPPGSSSSSLGRRVYKKGLQTLIWRADDENDDELKYEVRYRREGETVWKTLRTGIPDPILVWDTATVPNGMYFVKVVASDSPSNSSDMALSGELDSAVFYVDNKPPAIVITGTRIDGGLTIVGFDVKEDHSTIRRVEFSLDGQQWTGAFPEDGIADSRQEHYELTIDGDLGERGLTLRATDSIENVATAYVDAPQRK